MTAGRADLARSGETPPGRASGPYAPRVETLLQPTRRTVVRSAAWTTSAVAVASAAPAYATTQLPEGITFLPGNTRVIPDGDFWSVQFEDATITIGGSAPATQLTMTVIIDLSSGPNDHIFADLSAPVGWQAEPRSVDVRNIVRYTYVTPVVGGETVQISDGLYFGSDDVGQAGTFVVTFEATGFQSAEWRGSFPL